jgi:Domain of unknown function (DUF4307)
LSTRALPEGRYGSARGRAPRRWRRWVFTLIALVVSGAIAVVAFVNLGPAPISAERLSFAELPGNAMKITINVTRDEQSRPGVCIVRVRDISGAESGRREVLVPPGQSLVSAVIHSTDKPVDADVFGCSYDVPSYLSSS